MKSLILAIVLASSAPVGAEVIPTDDVVIINPSKVCIDLFGLNRKSNFSYTDWENYQYCIKYLHHQDQLLYDEQVK